MNTTSTRNRAWPLACACASILASAQIAQAAEPAEPVAELEEVVVTGFRLSLESSIEFKKESIGVVDSVSSEEIGKLPDVSIADALARLPGLAAQRVDGRAQVIALRGMAPKYAVTLLNGREMVSTGDNRSVEYDQFPSELIATAKVYKTQDAALMSQGLSGTVDLASVRPLDYSSAVKTLSIRGETNDNGELNDGYSDIGGRMSASYVDQFADGTIGVAVGYAHLDNPGQEKYYKSWWWADTSQWGASLPGVDDGAIALQGFEAGVTSTERRRDGLMGVLEFKPNDRLHSVVDLYYSKFHQESVQSELQASMDTWGGTTYEDTVYRDYAGDTFVVGGTVHATPIALSRYNDREDELYAAGWRTDYTIGEAWTVTADLAYSKAERDEENSELTMKANVPSGFSSIDVSLGDGGVSKFHPMVDYADPGVVMLMEQWGRGGRSSLPQVDDEMKSAQLNASRTLDGWLAGVDFGGSYSERTKEMNRDEVYYFLDDDSGMAMLSAADLNSAADLGFAGIPGVISIDFNRVLHDYYTAGMPASLNQQPGRNWDVTEKVARGFAKLNFDFGELDGAAERIRGNIGLQYVHTDQSSNGKVWLSEQQAPPSGALSPISGGTTYEDWLPSLNLSVEVTDQTIFRLGLAREMARPNIEDMRAGFSDVSASTTYPYRWSAKGGNPELEPWRANSLDLSIEHYFDRSSYVAAAYFYKDLKSFVYEATTDYDFTGFPNPNSGTEIQTYDGDLHTLVNGHGGMVKGIELSGVFDAALFSDDLEGMGIVLSYSHTESNLHEENNPAKSLEGLSGDVASAILYYERQGVSFRISDRYRSKFESVSRNQFGDNAGNAISSEEIVDAQIGYTFSSGGWSDGLSILLQALNLTDEPYRTSVASSTPTARGNLLMPERYNTYGRVYLLGASYKF